MNIFCSYAYTGEDLGMITKRMRLVVDTLTQNGHQVYCNMFDESIKEFQAADNLKAIFQVAFKNLDENEAVVAIVTSSKRSIGQLMEIGVAMSQQKPIYLFEHTSAKETSYLPKLVDHYAEWDTLDDLKTGLLKI